MAHGNGITEGSRRSGTGLTPDYLVPDLAPPPVTLDEMPNFCVLRFPRLQNEGNKSGYFEVIKRTEKIKTNKKFRLEPSA